MISQYILLMKVPWYGIYRASYSLVAIEELALDWNEWLERADCEIVKL